MSEHSAFLHTRGYGAETQEVVYAARVTFSIKVTWEGEGRWAVSTRALLAMGISKLSNERSLAMAWQRAKDGTGRSRRVPQRNSYAKKKR